MISGKTVISEDVFAELVKTAMSKVDKVAVSAADNSSLAAIAKKVAERVAPQVNVKKTDAITGEGEDATVGHVSFEVKRGETIGVIGESGCGKSTLGKAILQLIPATSGDVIYNGQSLMKLNQKEMNELRK